MLRICSEEKSIFTTKCIKKTGYPHAKSALVPYLIPYIQINSKLIYYLNVKPESIKFIEKGGLFFLTEEL